MRCDREDRDVRAATIALLQQRAADATICPSEVARAIATAAGTADWRAEMPGVHEAVDGMVADGLIRLSWKGVAMPVREGPYRILGRGETRARSAVTDGAGLRHCVPGIVE